MIRVRNGFIPVISLVVALAACGGGGGSDTPIAPSQLFVVDQADAAIASFPSLDVAPGSAPRGRVLTGFPQLGNNVAYDAASDVLYVPSGGLGTRPSVVSVIPNASAAQGAAAPARTITLPADVGYPLTVFLDRANDRLYVGGEGTYEGHVVVIEHASAAQGVVTPQRDIVINEGVASFAIDRSRRVLYVVNSNMGVHAYAGVDAANGPVQPTRNFGTTLAASGIAVDEANDRVYVAGDFWPSGPRGVHWIDGASAASGYAIPGSVAIPGAAWVTLDGAHDRLYVGAGSAAYVLGEASALGAGASAPAAVAMGPEGSRILGFAFP